MSSDWQYIEDHMGGHDEDGMPNFTNEVGFYAETDEEWIADHNDYYGTCFDTMDELNDFIDSLDH